MGEKIKSTVQAKQFSKKNTKNQVDFSSKSLLREIILRKTDDAMGFSLFPDDMISIHELNGIQILMSLTRWTVKIHNDNQT